MLTSGQLSTLKSDIEADSQLNTLPHNDDSYQYIAEVYNLLASPDFIVWRTNVSTAEIKKAVAWTEYIGRSTGERDAFVLMIADGTINSAATNVRAGFSDIFSGVSGATTRAALTALAKCKSTRAEKLFASGTGSDASPATMVFEGNLSYRDVQMALNS